MENLTVRVFDEFGAFCGNGEKASIYRHANIDPYVHEVDSIVLDFSKVEMVNSSFVNALVANLISHGGYEVYGKIEFVTDDDSVNTMIEIARDLGVSRLRKKMPA